MNLSLFKNIYVHSWGGLGSQLFAYSTAEYILQKYPKKQIRIILHSSGVTKRAPALDFLRAKYQIVIKDDFDNKSLSGVDSLKLKLRYKQVVRVILQRSYLILEGNNTIEQKKIKPWTLVLRGHYSYAEISKNTLKIMAREIEKSTKSSLRENCDKTNYLGLHYRLGDLVKLDHKSYVDPDLIFNYISQITEDNEVSEIHIYSDDLDLARSLLSNKLDKLVFKNEADIWITMVNLIHSSYFVGSNSKISIWIILFRLLDNPSSWNAIPLSMKENLEKIWPQISAAKNIFYY